jgi:hypothetical protein
VEVLTPAESETADTGADDVEASRAFASFVIGVEGPTGAPEETFTVDIFITYCSLLKDATLYVFCQFCGFAAPLF